MKKKLKLNPQEFSAVIVESIASACLAASGVSPEQAEFIGKGLGSVVKGITASDNSSGDTILASIEQPILYWKAIHLRSLILAKNCCK